MNKKIGWALVGCGDIANKSVAPAIASLDSCDFVGVYRKKVDLAEQFAKKHHAKKAYKTYDELLSDPQVDAVYIATPVFLHAELTIAAAKAKKHVLCEKPMALSVNQCQQMIDACTDNNVKLAVAYYRRFYPAVKHIKEILRSGAIGPVTLAQAQAFEFFDLPENDERHWFLEKQKAGGGPMFDFGCHRIELLMHLFGNITQIKGFCDNIVFKNRDVEDTSTAVMRFENGAQGIVTVTHASAQSKDTLDIYGTKGAINAKNLNQGIIDVTIGGQTQSRVIPPEPNRYTSLIEDFSHAVLENRQPLANADIGLKVNELLEQIYKK